GPVLIDTPGAAGAPAGERLAAAVLPRPATLARCDCSFDVKNRPCATFQLLTAGHDGVGPTIVVNQLVPPATAWALVCDDGAAAATSGTSWAMASASASLSDVRVPVPRLTPPLLTAPGMTMTRLAPRLSICASTAACAPEPIAIEVITAPTPMMMPSIVKMDRVALRRMACRATRSSTVKL